MTTLNTPSSHTSQQVRRTLNDSIARVRRRLLLRSLLRWVGCGSGMLAIGVAFDIIGHFGPLTRWIMLGIIVWTAIWLYRQWVINAQRISPSPSDMALNLTEPAPALAALVDLQASESCNPIEQSLLAAIKSRSSRRIPQDTAKATLRAGPLYEIGLILLGLSLLIVLVTSRPSLLTIGVRRIATPWTDVQWPVRFGITIPEIAPHHPSDRAFIASALIGPSTDDPIAKVRWRLLDSNNTPIIRWTTLALNPQGNISDHQQRYEQLIPIHTLSAQSIPDGATLEYRIQTRDDRSQTRRILIVHPPKLRRVVADISLPVYAEKLESSSTRFMQGQQQINPSELSIGPILAGSSVSLQWEFDTQVHTQNDNSQASSSIKIDRVLDESSTLTTLPVDQYGLSPRAPMDVFVRVVADAPPEAIITVPVNDLMVGQRAIVEIAAQTTDDLGLNSASIIGDQIDASQSTRRQFTTINPNGSIAQPMTTTLDIESIDLKPGQRIEVRAMATDIGGLESRSSPRIIRIVEDKEIVDQIESQLGSIGDILRRLDDQQRELLARIQDESGVNANDQSTLTDQIKSRTQATNALRDQLAQSRIRDPQISPMLDALSDALSEAQKDSERASEAIQREQDQQAADRMEDVRDKLGKAIAMLDRGQDTWLARRAIEELRSQVQSLLDDTNQLGDQIGGKSMDQLSPDERSMLQKILDKQRRTAQEARQTIDALDEQADALDENNPTGAQGLRDAATQGRNSGVEEQLDQAADEIAQNQTSSAAATQQQVLEELDKMLEHIEQAQKNRDSALRRKLASFIESIKAIIQDQQHELARLDENQPGLDDPLIALRNNTLSIRDDAESAFPETQSIADSLTRATESQGEAIAALRSDPIDSAAARRSQLAAITHLKAALDEAQRQDEKAADRQAQQLREQLRSKYQEALKEQSTITTQTEPLIGQDLNRRQRSSARQLGQQEDAIRQQLATMLQETSELSDAPIFTLAHDQMNMLLQSISDNLNQRTLDPMTTLDQQSVATILTALIEVLGQSQQQQSNDFEDGQSEGGGGGGGGSGGGQEPVLPPIAQLQLLRTLQQLTATQTRAISESDAPDPRRIRQIGQLQQDLAEKGQKLIEDMNPPPPIDEQSIDEPVVEPNP
ncbi:MAG: hypothetical protein JKY43_09635 [Phycisphaerales bacterium]|nr:hypothetical protein [Phycisphaerales bacterium]